MDYIISTNNLIKNNKMFLMPYLETFKSIISLSYILLYINIKLNYYQLLTISRISHKNIMTKDVRENYFYNGDNVKN